MSKISRIIALLTFMAVVGAPLIVQAAEKNAKSEVVMKMGKRVHLFHSGPVHAQKEIAIGDVLTVYREFTKTRQQKEVGQVKVLSFIGDHYFEAEVVTGEIKIGDIAKKDTSALLVQPVK